jgi:hypothetical protein
MTLRYERTVTFALNQGLPGKIDRLIFLAIVLSCLTVGHAIAQEDTAAPSYVGSQVCAN